jgi:hypothetical protein
VHRLLVFCLSLAAFAQPRQVAITIDDLPRGGDTPRDRDLAAIRAMTVKLLGPLRGVPLIGFVNAGRAEALGDAGLQEILKIWLDHGATLGNHTYDEAYRLPDAYYGTGGFSWIHRWSKTKGIPPKGEPEGTRLDRGRVQEEVRASASARSQKRCSVDNPVGQAILPAAGFQPAGPAGKRVRSLDRLPHKFGHLCT